MLPIANRATRNFQALIRDLSPVNQIDFLVPEGEATLKPFRDDMFIRPICVIESPATKETDGASKPTALDRVE